MSLAEKLLELVMPRRCVFCGALWKEPLPCPDCQRELPWLLDREGEREVELLSRCASALRYQEGVRRAVHDLKFHGRVGYLRTLGPIVADCARDRFAGEGIDLVTWVPLSPKSLRDRGFDQAQRLAAYAGAALGLPAVPVLAKKNGVGQQSLLGEEAARRANVLGAYRVADPAQVEGKRVLLVDDVVTSGATLSECALSLRLAGCADVMAVTLARAGK